MSFPPNSSDALSHGGALARQGAGRSPSSGAAVNLALDNMLRNHLRVSNPRDAGQVAQGLLAYYQDLPQAAAIQQEALGMPYLQGRSTALPPAPATPKSSDAEYRIANSDIEKALTDLASNPLTNDITPEMQGWGDSIRTAIVQARAAAGQGLDPSQRDKVIAVRRQLGEYARMARFVGSMSPGMTQNFRRLGRALDEISAVLLVMLGESLASVGFGTGYYLLQVPLQELQQRRDAVIYALRNFTGGTQLSYGPDEWARPIEAYRRLYLWLEEQGQGDLRSLLLENEVAQAMDTLITRAQNGSSDGMRALGVTAQIDIERFRRMVIVAPGAMSGEYGHLDRSPPLEAYLQALALFAETFRSAGGLRLLRIARPPILLYGLYNMNQLEQDNALFDLIAVRGTLAVIFDELFPSDGARGVQAQVLLDMLLLELDRGIDLLALGAGTKEGGPTERRAIALWAIIEVIINLLTHKKYDVSGPQQSAGPIADYRVHPQFDADIVRLQGAYASAVANNDGLARAFTRYGNINQTKVPFPLSEEQRRGVAEELRVQFSLEDRWENLVRTIAPEAGNQEIVFVMLKKVVEQAAFEVLDSTKLIRPLPPLPPQFEQSLATLLRRP